METRYLIDTDILIDHLRGFRNISGVAKILNISIESMIVSAITVTEIYAGIKEFYPKKLEQAESLFLSFQVIPADYSIAKMAGAFRAKYNIELGDAMIAATVYIVQGKLVTRNFKHFNQIKDIKVKTV